MNWLDKDKEYIWHPFTPLLGVADPLCVTSASGVYLHTEDGRKIIDANSSWWVNIHGHAHPFIAEKVSEQAKTLEHVIFAGFTHKPAISLAENLLSILPKNQSKIFYSDNGSTSIEVALKMAFQFWYNQGLNKKRVIAIDGAYHGDTFGSMSVGERSDFTKPFTEHLFEVEFVDFPTEANKASVLERFKNLIDSNEFASFIFEPIIQGASGMRIYDATLLDQMIQYAQNNSVICIADEVMTGFGRTGKLFASDYLKYKPDIICLSKGLTGGTMALGVTSCTNAIVDAYMSKDLYKTFLHGHSFTANPIACASANASFELLMKQECQDNIQRITSQHERFKQKHEHTSKLKDIRSLGTILAIEFETENDSSYFSEMRNQLYPFFLERNILLRPLGNLIYIIPPYVISNDELEKVYAAIEEFFTSL
ncbi:adenosylmethionine--8-amino-7-oxononanoate transaminase [Fulvivirga sp. 29W222]|uniref:Adenosylmethionine-8-amino-7-oxononanoate aminotransferase n=1 Tax=Fulvivirga marina TaxID=2494733 RepID=A0A937FXZ3_9BACT|nr:adenosylmethionine--8-amino-7-oxononanoate transaminase [Fulvivirga marina]MBL6448195.1 adenosylmethionine--8-amino-7-oxononanoate transaminase [Fulvivirga marina]